MSPYKLSYGNLVFVPEIESIEKIISVSRDCVRFESSFRGDYNIHWIEPITLTTDFIKAQGFKQIDPIVRDGKKFIKDKVIVFDIYSSCKWENFSFNNHLQPLYYVHELQNLYTLVTGLPLIVGPYK